MGIDAITFCYKFACNFTDARLPCLNSKRVLGRGLTGIVHFLKVGTVMRPCDGTSGSVRKNRRRAVFTFRGCFPKDICHVSAIGQRIFLSRISEVRGIIGNHRAQPDFRQQNRRSRKRKTGVWSADLGFTPHFWNRLTEVCGKFRNPRAHCPFRAEKPTLL